MGLFTTNYSRPGPGVKKDGPEKRRIWQFFEIFWGQISKLCLMNIIYFIAMLPLVFGLFLCFDIDFSAPSLIVLRNPGSIDLIGLILLVASLFVSFPATVGFTFVLRNIQRREHAWIWHDFIKHTKANYFKGVINGIVTLALYYLLLNAHNLYYSQQLAFLGIANHILSTVVVILAIVFTWAQFYVNTMIVTFDLKLKDIYKNALLFAISRIPLNIFVSIVNIALAFGIYVLSLIIPVLGAFASIFILYSLFGYIVVFSVYPTIDKYMISVAKPSCENDTEGEIEA